MHLCPDVIETEGSYITFETDADFAKGRPATQLVGHGGQRPHAQPGCCSSGDIRHESVRKSLPCGYGHFNSGSVHRR